MKTTLNDLRMHLFEQLERLQDEDLDTKTEVARAQAMAALSGNIINSAKLEFQVRMKMTQQEILQSDFVKTLNAKGLES